VPDGHGRFTVACQKDLLISLIPQHYAGDLHVDKFCSNPIVTADSIAGQWVGLLLWVSDCVNVKFVLVIESGNCHGYGTNTDIVACGQGLDTDSKK